MAALSSRTNLVCIVRLTDVVMFNMMIINNDNEIRILLGQDSWLLMIIVMLKCDEVLTLIMWPEMHQLMRASRRDS